MYNSDCSGQHISFFFQAKSVNFICQEGLKEKFTKKNEETMELSVQKN